MNPPERAVVLCGSQIQALDSAPTLQMTAELQRYGRHDVALEATVSRLSLEPTVRSVSWNVQEPAALLAAEE